MEPNESQPAEDEPSRPVWVVLVDDEGMFSICEAGNAIAAGWRALGPRGTMEECLRFIDDNLTDMRPSGPWWA